jgi:predicted glycosyltransferase
MMKILISANHPAHVHLFKNLIWKMESRGHRFLIVARDKDKTIDLLDKYGFKYALIGKAETTPLGYVREMIERTKRFYSIIGGYKPDIVLTQMDPSPAIAAKIWGVPYLCLADSEPAKLILRGTMPFTQAVLTPSCFRTCLGEKHIYYSGYKELAYLHPNVFKPDVSVLKDLGVEMGDPYIVLRFVSWRAHHDIGEQGIQDKTEIVKQLEQHGRVFISSESKLGEGLEKYELKVSPEKIHDVLYYAHLLFCDSQTMTTEAGVLGTPAIRCNSFVGANDMGNFIELENKYRLIYNFSDENMALNFAVSLLEAPDIKEEWSKRQKNLLNDKIDVTAFLLWFVENYPQSFVDMKVHSEEQHSYTHIWD